MNKKLYIAFILAAFIISGCGKKADEHYAEASKLSKEEKYEEAIKIYEMILKDYPKDKFASVSAYDLAVIYQSLDIKNLTREQRLNKAIEYFTMVFDKYPESAEAPKSLFTAGFIYANELNDYDNGTKLYKLFIEKFPNNELAASAQIELDNMGQSPEEILKKNIR